MTHMNIYDNTFIRVVCPINKEFKKCYDTNTLRLHREIAQI